MCLRSKSTKSCTQRKVRTTWFCQRCLGRFWEHVEEVFGRFGEGLGDLGGMFWGGLGGHLGEVSGCSVEV